MLCLLGSGSGNPVTVGLQWDAEASRLVSRSSQLAHLWVPFNL